MDLQQAPFAPISGNPVLCAFVESSHLFKRVAPEDMSLVFAAGRLIRLGAGEIILREGELGHELFFIFKGTVRVMVDWQGNPLELARLCRGAVVGEVAFLTGRPRTASVIATEPVELIVFTRDDLDPLLQKYPKILKLLEATMPARAEQAIEKTCM